MSAALYCNVCGGPLSSANLRRLSLANEGDLLELCHNDECDCREYFELDEEVNDPGGMDPAYHDADCATQIGYVSWSLPEDDIYWLDGVRLIGAWKKNQRSYPVSKRDGHVFLTESGEYSGADSLNFEGFPFTFTDLSNDGFLVHETCYKILRRAASINNKPFTLRGLYLTMKACPRDPIAGVIDWKDPRSYGGAEMWSHGNGWRAQAGQEWLVTDPLRRINLAPFIAHASHQSIIQRWSPPWGSSSNSIARNSRPTPSDSPLFTTLPTEIKHMILEHLPSASVVNLSIASRAFHATTRYLPNSFWRSRLVHNYRWLRETGIHQLLDAAAIERGRPVKLNYYALLQSLDIISQPLPDGKLLKSGEPNWFAFKNYRRIWNCAEAIVDRVEARGAEFLVNYGARVQKIDMLNYVWVVNKVYVSLEKQILFVWGLYHQSAGDGDGDQRLIGGLLFEFADTSTQYVGDSRLYYERWKGKEINEKHLIFFDVAAKERITDTAFSLLKLGDGSEYQVINFSTSKSRVLALGTIESEDQDEDSNISSQKGGISVIIAEAETVTETVGKQPKDQDQSQEQKKQQKKGQDSVAGLDVSFRKGPQGSLVICGIEPVTGWEGV
ncbi:hypothetical protein BDV06DRAFT_219649 [Aspergillus oleicola]